MSNTQVIEAIESLKTKPFFRKLDVEIDDDILVTAEFGEVMFAESWLSMVEDWDSEEICIDVLRVIKALGDLPQEYVTSALIEAHGDFLFTLSVNMSVEAGGITREHNGKLYFDGVDSLCLGINGFEANVVTYRHFVKMFETQITQLNEGLSVMPSKGLKAEECQKTCLQGAINEIDHTLNGTSPFDFFEARTE